MEPNRIAAMRYLAKALRLEGQFSRADCVDELCDEVEQLTNLAAELDVQLYDLKEHTCDYNIYD